MFETPILFLLFNRPDTTKLVFAKIREVKPKYLFIAADGPRADRQSEKELCEQTRNLVMDSIDWDCEVKTLFRNENLGCGKAVSLAITWFFDNVEQGIILEDDCLPDLSFFQYCSDLLEKYRFDEQVFVIGGNNFQSKKWGKSSYYFSAYGFTWGWATWRRAWSKFDYSLQSIEEKQFKHQLKRYFPKQQQRDYWYCIYKTMKYIPIDTWDYQWTITQWYNNGINILPNINLVKNIGFGNDATHTKCNVDGVMNLETHHIDLIIHPSKKKINKKADLCSFYKIFEQKKIPPKLLYFNDVKVSVKVILKKIINRLNLFIQLFLRKGK